MKVVIFGSTGMLGSMVKRYLSRQSGYELICADHTEFEAEGPVLPSILIDLLHGQNYAINCIGVIKPRIDEMNRCSIEHAVKVNSLFPGELVRVAENFDCKVLQIVTDCVYSGQKGSYLESSSHDPLDVYGKTKSLGEVQSSAVRHLRCSIIGPEREGRPKDSLLEWFLKQPQGATVSGYMNHHWNGITTLAFARICHGIMSGSLDFNSLPPVQHVVPLHSVTKYGLLRAIAQYYNREDIHIEEADAPSAVDRTLYTLRADVNNALWMAAGYAPRPSIAELVAELAAYR